MAEIEIYTSPFCPYCHRAKALLSSKGVAFNDIDVMLHPSRRKEMRERAGGVNTVPQIFVDGAHIGDSERIADLDRKGELDTILGLSSAPEPRQ